VSYHVSKLINRAAELLGVDILRELHEVEGQGSVSGRKCARAASKIRERHRLISIDVRDGADRIAALEAQLEAARKDGERLDVLLRAITPTGQLVCGCYDPDDGDCDWSFIDLHGTPLIGHYDTPREAIDALAALEATTPENRK